MFYVICASPLAKIFQTSKRGGESFQQKCMENPEIVFDEKFPFDVLVNRPCGGIRLQYNRPHPISARDDKETLNLFNYLTGGEDGMRCPETDKYGIAPLYLGDSDMTQITADIVSLQMEMAGTEDPNYKAQILQQIQRYNAQIAETMVFARKRAREIADQRVLRAIRNTHRNLMKQWKHNKESGNGLYNPSATEFLGAIILEKELAKKHTISQRMNERMAGIMQNVRHF